MVFTVKGDALKEVTISEFKAKCHGILEQVRKTREPIRVTCFGEPVAEVVPPSPKEHPANWLGCMAGTALSETSSVRSEAEGEHALGTAGKMPTLQNSGETSNRRLYPLNHYRLHHHVLARLVLPAARDAHDFFDYVLALDYFAENRVIAR